MHADHTASKGWGHDVDGWNLARAFRRIKADVLVVGSGAAGTPAAIAAARSGARVVLVERDSTLGGTSTAVLDTFYGFFTPGTPTRIVDGIGGEVVRRLTDIGAAFERPNTYGAGTGVTYNPEILRVVWETMCHEAGISLLLHSAVVDVSVNDRQVREVLVVSGSELIVVEAQTIVDASGDAVVTHLAGGSAEGWSDIDDPQALTVTFTMSPVDSERWKSWDRARFLEAISAAAQNGYDLPRRDGSVHDTTTPGTQFVHMTKVAGFDPRDPVELAEAESAGRAQAVEYARFLRNYVAGFEQAQIAWMSKRIGVRESRRVRGRYWLERDDILSARRFDDAIARAAAPIEIHGSGRGTHWEYLEDGEFYEIPYRCLLPVDLDNIVVAGRCLSASHDAHASARNMAQCTAMGQAAGTAAAMSADQGANPSEIDTAELQRQLITDGALLDVSASR